MAVFLILILIIFTKETGVTVGTGYYISKVGAGLGAKLIKLI